jgi:hypothetical protein
MEQWKPTQVARKAIAVIARTEASRSWPCLAALSEPMTHENVYHPPSYKIDEIFKRESGYFEAKKIAVDGAGLFQKSRVSNEWFANEGSARSGYHKLFKKLFEKSLADFITLNKSKEPEDWSKLVNQAWTPHDALPLTGYANYDPRTAEFVCTRYFHFMGASSAVTTKKSKDSGIDIDSDFYVAQVKHLHSKVGVKALREFLGASISTGKIPVFFSKMGYTHEALQFGVQNKILLYRYTGVFEPCTIYSRIIQIEGMHTRWQDQPWMHSETGWSQGTKEKYGQDRWHDHYFRFMAI